VTAKLVDVPPEQTTGVPINFGTVPGFAFSQKVGVSDTLNAFARGGSGNPDRWASWTTGFGDTLAEAFHASNFADTGLGGGPLFDGGSRSLDVSKGARTTSSVSGGTNPPFSAQNDGSFSSTINRGDDGIDCFDASPTSGIGAITDTVGYAAMYLGNRCTTQVGSFTVGQLAPAATFNEQRSFGLGPFTAGQTISVTIRPTPGFLNIVIFEKEQSLLDNLPTIPGWSRIAQVPDGTPPGQQTRLVTVYWRVWQLGDPSVLQVTTPTAFSGAFVAINYINTNKLSPVITFASNVADGTSGDTPSVTTATVNNTVISILTKLAPVGTPPTPPAGWTVRSQIDSGIVVGGNDTYIMVADRAFPTPGTSTGTISWTGASSSFGVGFSIVLMHAPGLGSAATAGHVSFNGTNFQPDFVMFMGCDPLGQSQHDGTSWMYGAADSAGNQWCAIARSAYLSGPSGIGGILNQAQRYRRFYNDACIGHIGAASFANPTDGDIKIQLVSMDSDGFTLNIATMTDATALVYFMAVKVDAGAGGIRVGNGTARTTTGSQTVSGLPFAPQGVVVGSAQTTDNVFHNDYGAAVFGMTDGVSQRSYWARGDTAAGTGDPNGRPPCCPTEWKGSNVLTFANAASQTILSQANLTSLNSDGFTLNWATVDANAYQYGWVALHVDDATINSPVVVTDPVTNFKRGAGTVATVNFNGHEIPNSSDPVTYWWQYGSDPTLATNSETTHRTNGTGVLPVSVTEANFNVGATLFNAGFYYRLVVQTSAGCTVFGNILHIFRPPYFTFGNKYRITA